MTERLKLAELLDYAGRDWEAYLDECHESEIQPVDTYDDYVADCLLANGVIVPPVKIGQMVYIPWNYDGTNGIAFSEVTRIIIDGTGSYAITDLCSDDDGFLEKYNYGKFDFADFGKTVFLTRKGAEKALAERAVNIFVN